jgi:UDP-N-acetylglucosamine 3-dehydrogenase
MIRVGLVGTGDIGRVHARALRKREDVELCVCRGVRAEAAEKLARDFGARVYLGYEDMLRDPAVAAVDICVPNDLHRPFVEQAAAAGKQILCEKPMALTLEDANAMVEAADRAGVLLMIAHVLRFDPEYTKMRDMIRSKALGSCRAITLRRMLSLLMNVQGTEGWRHRPERMGGAILDNQIHDLDFLNWTLRLPERVFGASARSVDGGMNHAYATLVYSSGTVAMAESSFMLQGDPMIFSAKVVCDHGTLDYGLRIEDFGMHKMGDTAGSSAKDSRPGNLVCYRAGQKPAVLAQQDPDPIGTIFAAELSYFVDCALGEKPNTILPLQESLDTLRIALAVRDSALTGKAVEFK